MLVFFAMKIFGLEARALNDSVSLCEFLRLFSFRPVRKQEFRSPGSATTNVCQWRETAACASWRLRKLRRYFSPGSRHHFSENATNRLNPRGDPWDWKSYKKSDWCLFPAAGGSLRHACHERLEHPHQLREDTQSQVLIVTNNSVLQF